MRITEEEEEPAAYLKTYPNPVASMLTVEFFASEDDPAGGIEILNMAGITVGDFPRAMNSGLNVAVLDLSTLDRGVYFLIASAGDD